MLALLLVISEGMVGVCFGECDRTITPKIIQLFLLTLPPTGLMVSSLLDNEATAVELAIGIFYPIIFVGGVYTGTCDNVLFFFIIV